MRTAIPVEGRFEHIVLSCNAISDHRIVWIEREAQKALEVSNLHIPYFVASYLVQIYSSIKEKA